MGLTLEFNVFNLSPGKPMAAALPHRVGFSTMAPRRASRVLRSLNAALTPPAALDPSPASADETPNTALAARWAPCAPPPLPCPPGSAAWWR